MNAWGVDDTVSGRELGGVHVVVGRVMARLGRREEATVHHDDSERWRRRLRDAGILQSVSTVVP